MTDDNLVTWINLMAPDHNPKVIEFYTKRAMEIYNSCCSYVKSLE
ncbi:MAG: hypothetical protein P4L74_03395 [Candidatus Doudnabacteria bacterium]|nr:hypothetical protein [Candidatus Doudnabacteria bacterium]